MENQITVAGLPSTFAVVRSILKEMNLDLSPAGEKYVADTFLDKIAITTGPDHRVTYLDNTELNPNVDLRKHLNRLIAERTDLFLAGNDDEVTNLPNPWTKAGWNLTRQYMIERSDPERARKLQAEARQ